MSEWKVDLWTNSDALRNSKRAKTIGIMVHSTATPGVMAQAFRDRWNKPGLGKSVHFFVDDKEAIQCMPLELKAGHCGRGTSGQTANDTHLSFEMCEPKNWQTDADYFQKVYQNAVNLTAELCREYGLTEKDVLSHAEGYKAGIASNHADVGHWFPFFDKNMDDFRNDVRIALGNEPVAFVLTRNLKKGDSGADVIQVQRLLAAAGYKGTMDPVLYGQFGTATESSVKAFQKANKLEIDGIVGPKTAQALSVEYAASAFVLKRNLQKGDTGEDVAEMQKALAAAGYSGSMDPSLYGSFGSATEEAVEAFQKAKGLTVDGIVGEKTTSALGGTWIG